MGFVYFAVRIVWNFPFLMFLMNFFSYIGLRFCQNLSNHRTNNLPQHRSSNKHPQCSSFKLVKSNQFKADIKSRTGLTGNADMWLINLPKTACTILNPIQMSNQLAKFNTWKLIAARLILRQHNINVITTYCKYLIRQFNSTSEWGLISASNFWGCRFFDEHSEEKNRCAAGGALGGGL